jgi:radical SAM superfamily enzyme YgiQ (UPF0313 family)
MKVLLINPRQYFKQGNIWKSVMGCIHPIGLAQLAAFLRQNNVKVKILDLNAEYSPETGIEKLINDAVQEFGVPEFTGITATTNTYFQAIETAKIVKAAIPKTFLVFGGVHATILPDDFLKHDFIDFCVRGEGEFPFYELITGKDKASILSLSYRSNTKFIHNAPRPVLDDINTLPMLAYDLLPMVNYRPSLGSCKMLPAIGMITSRGCPGKCTFCYGQLFGKKIRYRSAEKIIDEIKYLIANYGIKEISFYDDTFSAIKPNLIKFCNLLVQENIKITWSCFSRTDYVNSEILKLMKMAGCHQICFGVESGDQGILDNIQKNTSLKTAKHAIELTRAAGIETRATFMLGNPGETMETMKKTYNFAIEINPDIALFNITTPFPGTAMFDWASKNGYINTFNWSDYDLSKPIMDIPGLKPIAIENCYKEFNRKFYLRPSYLLKRLLQLTSFSQLKVSLRAFYSICIK